MLGFAETLIVYLHAKTEANEVYRNMLMQGKFLEQAKEGIDRLPVRQTGQLFLLTGGDRCDGYPNAFYDGLTITFCYKLIGDLMQKFKTLPGIKDEQVGYKVGTTAIFVLFHELGHALIHRYQLPITGREEDAADQFAILSLTSSKEQQLEEIALDAATWFWLSSKSNPGVVASGTTLPLENPFDFFGNYQRKQQLEQEEKLQEQRTFADTHGLTEQRFYNISCWVYGNNPIRWRNYVDRTPGLQKRKKWCSQEAATMERSWKILLKQYTQ